MQVGHNKVFNADVFCLQEVNKMKFAVINGSPKGQYSITLQTVRYLELVYPEHEFEVLHAGQKIKSLEKDFSKAQALLERADAVIFAYPVYTFLAPSQLHRFIELLKENGIDLQGKIATQITTSKHFYDVTAHKYIEENCGDLGMHCVGGLSADMEDLLSEKGREEAEKFMRKFLFAAEKGIFEKTPVSSREYNPCEVSCKEYSESKKDSSKDVVIITDCTDKDSNLDRMISCFRADFRYKTRVVNISEYPLIGGCLGCFRCAVSEKCVYKDGFDRFLREEIQTADAIVYAFRIKDHSMGARFKMYDDRNFCNGHRTVTVGMPVGYIVSGDYSAEHNLKTVIEARAQTGGNYLAYVADDSKDTEEELKKLEECLCFALDTKHTEPRNFYGVGGMKIFRDLIYQMRGMMRADHKFYKKQGIYDFPQKKKLDSMKMYLVGAMLSNEKVLSKMGNRMNDGMLAPYNKLFETLKKDK